MNIRHLTGNVCLTAILALPFANTFGADGWVMPRTVDGQPDLQGVWINPTLTPMERPDDLGDREFLSDDEIAALEARTASQRARSDADVVVEAGRNVGGYNQFWLDSGAFGRKPRSACFAGSQKNRGCGDISV